MGGTGVRPGPSVLVSYGCWPRSAINSTSRPIRGSSIAATVAQLHNLADVGETTDLADKEPDKVKALQAAWDAWNKGLPEPGWLPQPPKKKK